MSRRFGLAAGCVGIAFAGSLAAQVTSDPVARLRATDWRTRNAIVCELVAARELDVVSLLAGLRPSGGAEAKIAHGYLPDFAIYPIPRSPALEPGIPRSVADLVAFATPEQCVARVVLLRGAERDDAVFDAVLDVLLDTLPAPRDGLPLHELWAIAARRPERTIQRLLQLAPAADTPAAGTAAAVVPLLVRLGDSGLMVLDRWLEDPDFAVAALREIDVTDHAPALAARLARVVLDADIEAARIALSILCGPLRPASQRAAALVLIGDITAHRPRSPARAAFALTWLQLPDALRLPAIDALVRYAGSEDEEESTSANAALRKLQVPDDAVPSPGEIAARRMHVDGMVGPLRVAVTGRKQRQAVIDLLGSDRTAVRIAAAQVLAETLHDAEPRLLEHLTPLTIEDRTALRADAIRLALEQRRCGAELASVQRAACAALADRTRSVPIRADLARLVLICGVAPEDSADDLLSAINALPRFSEHDRECSQDHFVLLLDRLPATAAVIARLEAWMDGD
ncbi:MAG: hypothetical protein HZB39_10430, partial [Planctomycetes bacterium]|nr:hypothetical protein [Planctomycetota bacterium]